MVKFHLSTAITLILYIISYSYAESSPRIPSYDSIVGIGTMSLVDQREFIPPATNCNDQPKLISQILGGHLNPIRQDVNHKISTKTFIDEVLRGMDPFQIIYDRAGYDFISLEAKAFFEGKSSCEAVESAIHSIQTNAVENTLNTLVHYSTWKSVLDKNNKDPLPKEAVEEKAKLRKIQKALGQFLRIGISESHAISQLSEMITRESEIFHLHSSEITSFYLARALMQGLDPHSNLKYRATAEEPTDEHLSQKAVGTLSISVEVSTLYPLVTRVGKNTFIQSELTPGDQLIAFKNKDAEPFRSLKGPGLRTSKLGIHGAPESIVTYLVWNPANITSPLRQVKIQRFSLAPSPSHSHCMNCNPSLITAPNHAAVMILRIPKFEIGTSMQVKSLLQRAIQKNAEALVIDLTDNPGGIEEEVVKVAGLFFKSATMMLNLNPRTNHRDSFDDQDSEILWTKPLVIHVNGGSASGAEALAAIMKDYGRALVVGERRTFGKATVTESRIFPEETEDRRIDPGEILMERTSSYYFTPGGASIHFAGLAPHFALPISKPNAVYESSFANALRKPQPIPSFASSDEKTGRNELWKSIDQEIINKTKLASEARIQVVQETNGLLYLDHEVATIAADLENLLNP